MPEKLAKASIRHVRKGKQARTDERISRKGYDVITISLACKLLMLNAEPVSLAFRQLRTPEI
tara:strand:- start:9898 stop:10083 length:186 start_codon:yes stop_codon:yes gene_type:complete